jgi:hypothetical protein
MSDVATPSVHDLLLALAGRLDDDLLAWARELVAVGEQEQAVELATAALAAERVVLPPPLRTTVVAAARAAHTDLNVERALPEGAPEGGTPHRFDASAASGDEIVAALTALPARRLSGCTLHLTWRCTPAGAAPGPLPHAVVLVEADPDRSADVLAYLLATELGRTGAPASVEVFTVGTPLPAYHAAALRAACQIARGAAAPDAPSDTDVRQDADTPPEADAPRGADVAQDAEAPTETDVPPARPGLPMRARHGADPVPTPTTLRVVPPPDPPNRPEATPAETTPAEAQPDQQREDEPVDDRPDEPDHDPLSGPLSEPLLAPLLEPTGFGAGGFPHVAPAPAAAGPASIENEPVAPEPVAPEPAALVDAAELPDEWADDWRSGDWAMPADARRDAPVAQQAPARDRFESPRTDGSRTDSSGAERTRRRGHDGFGRPADVGRSSPTDDQHSGRAPSEGSLFDSPTARVEPLPPRRVAAPPGAGGPASAAPFAVRPRSDDPMFGPMQEVPLFSEVPGPDGPVPDELAPGSPRRRRRRPEPDEPASATPAVAEPPSGPEPSGSGPSGSERSGALSGTERDLLAQLQAELAARERHPRPYRRAGQNSGARPVNGHGSAPNCDPNPPDLAG